MRFPENHPVEILRGGHKATKRMVLKTIAARAAWLQQKIEQDFKLGKHRRAESHYGYDELRVIVQLLEFWEAHKNDDGSEDDSQA